MHTSRVLAAMAFSLRLCFSSSAAEGIVESECGRACNRNYKQAGTSIRLTTQECPQHRTLRPVDPVEVNGDAQSNYSSQADYEHDLLQQWEVYVYGACDVCALLVSA